MSANPVDESKNGGLEALHGTAFHPTQDSVTANRHQGPPPNCPLTHIDPNGGAADPHQGLGGLRVLV
jgi:hypothetical protein